MKNKKDIIILPKVNYNIKYNRNNTPNINTKKNDYDAVRDIVENNEDKTINKVDNNFITKISIYKSILTYSMK